MAVALYSTPTCAYCRKAKEYLRERKVQFTEYNVATNQAKADEMMKKSGQMGVPVIDIHGRVIVGFNQPEIERALHR
ncbi:MAG: glutaredoxin domain-containing protein [Spirochaetia bacterium]|jgi:glutaredoxin-like YruB-family protein|nr:glutathione S-transferase N-terminal domain-containing protein [Spirochaetia bacterium]MDZ7795416.1 glutaredoxin domain-containing protein [Spirochaetia bacterium]